MVYNTSYQTASRSEASMREIRGGISEVTNSASAQMEEVGLMKAEVMQKLQSISDRLEVVPNIASEQLSTLQSLVKMMSDMKLAMRAGGRSTE